MDLRNFFKQCRKIVAVGRNYREHVLELNNAMPKKPLLFLKPPSSMIQEGQVIKIPPMCASLHHEVELGIIIGEAGYNISEENAHKHIGGYALALDMTARDLQEDAKKAGQPWLLAKSWDTFCPISDFIPAASIPDPQSVKLWLKVDGVLKQSGNTNDMIFPIPHIISYISGIMSLEAGDLILTGTPSGVGPVKAGQVIECGLEGIKEMKFTVE